LPHKIREREVTLVIKLHAIKMNTTSKLTAVILNCDTRRQSGTRQLHATAVLPSVPTEEGLRSWSECSFWRRKKIAFEGKSKPHFPVFRCVRKTAKSDYELRHVCPSAWNISDPTARIFMKFDI
jgi:hypothetical protein